MNRERVAWLLVCGIVMTLSSCQIDEVITTPLPPKIILDNESGIYAVKQGRELTIAPQYEMAEGATFCWSLEGKVVGTSTSLTFCQEQVGSYYLTLTVRNEGGVDEEEMRIDVVELEVPTVSIASEKHQTVAVGTVIRLSVAVRETSLPTKLVWSINGEEVGSERELLFQPEQTGTYTLTATASNEDGSHSDSAEVEVLRAEDMPIVWEFERESYHTVKGRKLLIQPVETSPEEQMTYSWSVEGMEGVTGTDAHFIFLADKAGEYTVRGVASAQKGEQLVTLTCTFPVTVYEEKQFYRPSSGASQADWNRVMEYTPAPGQFINDRKTGGFDDTHTSPEGAIAYAEKRLREANWISLGGFGGYVTLGFDHSIDNKGGYDLAVVGNAFDGSSEPGIVWVMQDENGNGMADDTWYELAGSEQGKAETVREYAVTYYRPTGPGMSVSWSDNRGNRGEIDYLKAYHDQEYYYPLWIENDHYTLKGTRLEARNYDKSGNGSFWVQPHYDWGYADNYSPMDFQSTDKANLFKISHAIDFEGMPVRLSHIDFVKIQCAVNAKSGWLGELSTEVCGCYDYTLKSPLATAGVNAAEEVMRTADVSEMTEVKYLSQKRE